jgi:hypothetical protein
MDEREKQETADPAVMRVERRKQGREELTTSDVMKLVRKRSTKKLRTPTGSGDNRG